MAGNCTFCASTKYLERSKSLCPKLHVFCHFAHELLSPPSENCMLKTPRPDHYLAKTENTEKKEMKKDEEHLEETDGFSAGAGADSTAAARIRACR